MKQTFTSIGATLLLLLLCPFAFQSKAQVMSLRYTLLPFASTAAPYSGYGPYAYLSGGTRVAAIEKDEGYANSIPLGFTFHFNGPTGVNGGDYSYVSVSSNGWLRFGTSSTAQANNTSFSFMNNLMPGVWPLWDDLSGAGGTASYLTEVLPSGSKVFTMEWKDWRWRKDAAAAGISFQVKLYEGSNIIEFWYKQEAGAITTTSSNKAIIGMGYSSTYTSAPSPITSEYISLSNSSAAPALVPLSFGPVIDTRPATDQVYQFYQPCDGKPEAGIVSGTDSACSGAPFDVKLYGHTWSPAAGFGMTYRWQSAPSPTGPWTDLPLGVTPAYTFTSGITAPIYLRCILNCTTSGLADTTPVHEIKMINLSYNCYCQSRAQNDNIIENIGNVKITNSASEALLDNGSATPAYKNTSRKNKYTLCTGVRPVPELNRDSTYRLDVSGITEDDFAIQPCGVATYIDFNQNGLYDVPAEMVSFKVLSGTTIVLTDNFTVPASAKLGITGMRVVMRKGATTPGSISPCGNYPYGETEDYIVNITYPKCNGPILPGTAYISDTSSCPDYTVTVWDTTHARNLSRTNWIWEYSLDNINWAVVPGTSGLDVITPAVKQTTWYRLRIICEVSRDTLYSNKVRVKLKQPYKCYCHSMATGGVKDTADVTTIILHDLVINTGGPHLRNPMSVRSRTDRTDLDPLALVAGQKYHIGAYHTLPGNTHSDAKITAFIDYNHNLAYDAPDERVWTAYTTATKYFIHDSIVIPTTVIPGVVTGLRFILNSNTDPNTPSDKGCGTYVSGETEDYLVIFSRPSTGVGSISSVSDLSVYPNPGNGRVTVSFRTPGASSAVLSVTNIAGQEIFRQAYGRLHDSFSETLHLEQQPKGIYLLTLDVDGERMFHKLVID